MQPRLDLQAAAGCNFMDGLNAEHKFWDWVSIFGHVTSLKKSSFIFFTNHVSKQVKIQKSFAIITEERNCSASETKVRVFESVLQHYVDI